MEKLQKIFSWIWDIISNIDSLAAGSAELNNLIFTNIRLKNSDLSNAELRYTDLSNVNLKEATLKGAVLNTSQVIYLNTDV